VQKHGGVTIEKFPVIFITKSLGRDFSHFFWNGPNFFKHEKNNEDVHRLSKLKQFLKDKFLRNLS